MIKCIVCYEHSGFGDFPKEAYDYLTIKYGKDIADSILTCKDNITKYNFETDKEEILYFPIGDLDEARFNKYLIEIVENIDTKYFVKEGILDIEEYDGMDKSIKIIF